MLEKEVHAVYEEDVSVYDERKKIVDNYLIRIRS